MTMGHPLVRWASSYFQFSQNSVVSCYICTRLVGCALGRRTTLSQPCQPLFMEWQGDPHYSCHSRKPMDVPHMGIQATATCRKPQNKAFQGKGLAYQRSSAFQLSTVICLSHISLSFVSASMSSRACIFCGGPAAPGSPPQPVMDLDYRVIYIWNKYLCGKYGDASSFPSEREDTKGSSKTCWFSASIWDGCELLNKFP